MCFRRESGKCAICFIPAISTPGTAGSFGISVSPGTAAQSGVGMACTTDYLELPGGEASTLTVGTTDAAQTERLCGRFFNSVTGQTDHVSVCSKKNLPYWL